VAPALARVGLAIGTADSLGTTRLISGLLYDVSTADQLTFEAVGALLVIVSGAACWIQARRAMRADPMTALRHE